MDTCKRMQYLFSFKPNNLESYIESVPDDTLTLLCDRGEVSEQETVCDSMMCMMYQSPPRAQISGDTFSRAENLFKFIRYLERLLTRSGGSLAQRVH